MELWRKPQNQSEYKIFRLCSDCIGVLDIHTITVSCKSDLSFDNKTFCFKGAPSMIFAKFVFLQYEYIYIENGRFTGKCYGLAAHDRDAKNSRV